MLKEGIAKEELFPTITNNMNNNFRHLNKTKIIVIVAIIFIVALICFFVFKKPTVTLIGDEVEKVSYKNEFIDSGITVQYYGKDITNNVIMSNNVNINELGEYEITYKIPYILGTYIYKRKAIVVDNMPPEITLEGDEELKISKNKEYVEPGYKAIDNYDGNITDKVETWQEEINDDEMDVHYKVSDKSGNVQEKIRKVHKIEEPLIPDEENIGKAAMNVGEPGMVYLTFDDGPSNTTTPQILDILKSKGVKATFFILDYGEGTEHLVKRIVEEGHAIAIHSKSHEYSTCYASPDAYLNGIDYMREKIKNTTGVETRIIRFPGGSSNTVSRKYYPGVMSILAKETLKRGYRYFDWNVASGDSGGVSTSEEVYNNVTSGLKNTRSNIVLMHDFSGNQKTVGALSDIIDFATSNGYRFDRITNKTPMVTQAVQN